MDECSNCANDPSVRPFCGHCSFDINKLMDKLESDKLHLVERFSRSDLEFLEANQSAVRAFIRDAKQFGDIKVSLTIRGKTITHTTIERTIVEKTIY